MITPSQFRAALLAAAQAALPAARQLTTAVNWAGGARELADLRVLLDVVSEVSLSARDDLFAADGQELSELVETTVQFRAESTYDSADTDALDLLHNIRFGLNRSNSVRAVLEAAGVVLIEQPGPTRNVSFRSNNRLVSSHAFECIFRCVFGLATEESTGLIEHVEISGDLDAASDSVAVDEFTVDDPTPEP